MSKLYSPEYLAYCAEQGVEPDSQVVQLFFSQGCRAAPDSFSPPAQKPVSELGGSGAGLVGNPYCGIKGGCTTWCGDINCKGQSDPGQADLISEFCDSLPATMTGDAWESAARHVLAMRQKAPEPCLFPQPKFQPPSSHMWTGFNRYPVHCIDGFYLSNADTGPIDAPEYLPKGGHDTLGIHNRCVAFSVVSR